MVEKEEKYTIKPEKLGSKDITKIETYGIVVGSCGTICQKTADRLRKLKILSHGKTLQRIAMTESARIMKGHLTQDDHDGG